MAKKKFVLPDDVEIDLTGGNLSIRFDGDVVLHQSLGARIGTIEASGNVELHLAEIHGTILSGGKISFPVATKVDAERIVGRDVDLTSGASLKVKAVQASKTIKIGPSKITCDVLIAPRVSLDPNTTGRVTVIESGSEWGPSKIKGGLSVADYDEIIGDSEEFLRSRGIGELEDAPLEPIEIPAADEAETEADIDDIDEEEEPETALSDEDIGDPVTLEVSDLMELEPVEEEPEVDDGPPDELQRQLQDALNRIVACYDGAELPGAVAQLQTMVKGKQYAQLKLEITEVWNGLLGFHQQKGIRPHHQVTHAFNVIHGLVQTV